MHTVMMEHMGSLGVTLNPFQESPWGAGGAEGEDFNTLSLPACPLPYLSFFFPSSVYMMNQTSSVLYKILQPPPITALY